MRIFFRFVVAAVTFTAATILLLKVSDPARPSSLSARVEREVHYDFQELDPTTRKIIVLSAERNTTLYRRIKVIEVCVVIFYIFGKIR